MNQVWVHAGAIFPAGLIVGSAMVLVAPLAWLAGLIIVLRGTKPEQRASLLRAYAECRPAVAPGGRVPRCETRRAPGCRLAGREAAISPRRGRHDVRVGE
jgi:hypothetical protein